MPGCEVGGVFLFFANNHKNKSLRDVCLLRGAPFLYCMVFNSMYVVVLPYLFPVL